MVIEDFSGYSRIQGQDGQTYVIVFEMPMQKVLVVAESDIINGLDRLPVILMEKPI